MADELRYIFAISVSEVEDPGNGEPAVVLTINTTQWLMPIPVVAEFCKELTHKLERHLDKITDNDPTVPWRGFMDEVALEILTKKK